MELEDKIDWATLATLAAVLLLTIFGPGCVGGTPPSSLCDFHKRDPEANLIRSQLESACFSGHSPQACEILNKLYNE